MTEETAPCEVCQKLAVKDFYKDDSGNSYTACCDLHACLLMDADYPNKMV